MSAAERAEAEANPSSLATGKPLPFGRLLAYSLIEAPVAGVLNMLSLYLGFIYTERGVSFGAVSVILMIARLVDVAIDPAVGLLSDRTRNGFGRRKTWVVAGTPIFVVAAWRLFVPPAEVDTIYFAVWMVLFWLGFSMINIPYYAWGAEISPDYHERTRITTVRTMLGTLGSVASLAVPIVLWQWLGREGRPEPPYIAETVIAYSAWLLPCFVALAVLRVPDVGGGGAAIPILKGLAVMRRNGPFLRLLGAFTIVGLGPVLQGAMFPYFMQNVVRESRQELLLLYFPTVFCGIAFWALLARRFEKHVTWMFGMGVMVAATSLYLFVGEGDIALMATILVISGVGSGALSALPSSMKADVVDLDALESGTDRAGIFFAAWSLAVKFIAAVGQGVAFGTLALIGFQRGTENGPDEILGLRIFYSAGPMLLYLIGLLLIRGYPITSARHAQLRAELAARGVRPPPSH
jgi:GPH family glycoside/pentoside/hexuronide:cation symporter